jgi:hypothetical protein
VHSNSWGSDAAGAYTADSANTDDFIWNHRDMTITFSAGNAGVDANSDGVIDSGSMGAPATAKNVISVGASENDRQGHYECDASLTYTNCAAQGAFNTIFTYGAAWPTDYPANPIKNDPSARQRGPDGGVQQPRSRVRRPHQAGCRRAGHVGAVGILRQISAAVRPVGQPTGQSPTSTTGGAYPLNRYYKYMGGTSMSNPWLLAAPRSCAISTRRPYSGMNASAALVKATIVNSAVDMLDENNDGVNDNANPIPNRHEGWGRVDLNSATNGRRQFVDGAASLTTGDERDLHVHGRVGWLTIQGDARVERSCLEHVGGEKSGERSRSGGDRARWRTVSRKRIRRRMVSDRRNRRSCQQSRKRVCRLSAGRHLDGCRPGLQRSDRTAAVRAVVDGVFGTAAPPGAPSTPDGLAAVAVSTTRVDLSWTDSDTEDRFDILRCAGAGCSSFAKIGQSPANVVTYSDITAAPSTIYSYRVQAANANGLSGYSNTATVTTPTPPPVPIHVGDLDGSTATSKNTWTASVTITVHNASDGTVQGATVSGNWSGGFSGSASCATGLDGACKVTTTNLNKSRTSATFTVTNVTATGASYVSSSNHDPDGDSDGTTITVIKP